MCNCSTLPVKKMRGLGATGTQIGISSGGAMAGTIAGALIGGPIGALAGGAISVAAGAISSLFTPDYTKIYASNDANLTSQQMFHNLAAWDALPIADKVPAVQQFFINNYETLWNAMVQYCSNSQLGTAGQKCITDREPGGKFPYASYYLDPIQNDKAVHPQTGNVTFTDPLSGTNVTVMMETSVTSSVSNAINSAVSNPSGLLSLIESNPLYLAGAVGLLLILL